MENSGYLFAAYTIIWAIIFGYVFFLYYKQRRLQRQMDSLKDSMGERRNMSTSPGITDDNPE